MATATIVKRIRDIGDYRDPNVYEVVLNDDRSFRVRIGGFVDRCAIIVENYLGTNINEIAEIIEGCFKAESNFFEKASYFCGNERIIKLKYGGASLLISSENSSAEKIIKCWQRQSQLLVKGDYYIVGVRKLKPMGEYDGICYVLAESEEEAIEKASYGYDVCECTCFGVYNKKKNTFVLNDARRYLDIDKMFKVED